MKIAGKTVKDAKKELFVTITPPDVKAGATKNSNACAAARALVRSGVCEEAKVHVNRTYIKQGNKWTRYKTPPALQKEIIAFDRGGSFEPGDYKLIPVPMSDRNAGRQRRANNTDQKGKYTKGDARKPRRKQHVTTGVRQRMNVGGRIV